MSVTEPTTLPEGLHPAFDLNQLRESDDNPRYITDEALDRLEYSLREDPKMLEARPIIADQYGDVICGNMRLRGAVERLGWTTAPVYVHHFRSDAERREWMLRDNQEYGDWVPDQLAALVARHVEEGADTKLLGFDDDEVMALVRRATGEAIVPEPSEPPKPELASEVMVEMRLTREAFGQIEETLEDWQANIDGLEIAVSS